MHESRADGALFNVHHLLCPPLYTSCFVTYASWSSFCPALPKLPPPPISSPVCPTVWYACVSRNPTHYSARLIDSAGERDDAFLGMLDATWHTEGDSQERPWSPAEAQKDSSVFMPVDTVCVPRMQCDAVWNPCDSVCTIFTYVTQEERALYYCVPTWLLLSSHSRGGRKKCRVIWQAPLWKNGPTVWQFGNVL